MMICFEIGETLKIFRERAKLSKKEVADYLGLTSATITNYEAGSTYPSLKNMAKLKVLYGPEFDYCIGKIVDDGKTPYFAFRTPAADTSEETLSPKEKLFPRISEIKAYLDEYDKKHTRKRAIDYSRSVIETNKTSLKNNSTPEI